MSVVNCRKRPLVVQGIRYTGEQTDELARFLEGADWICNRDGPTIRTLEGVHKVSIGDWIIRGVKGEFYPCKPDVFDTSYDIVPEQ